MRALNILVSIGSVVLDHKGIKELTVERNFADISNSFTLNIVDSSVTALYDLELTLNSGYRNIKISYYDKTNIGKMLSFSGTVWDYTATFVGGMKELKLSGFVSKTSGVSLSGEAKYNIDFNSYYNLRVNEAQPWGALNRVKHLYDDIIPSQQETLEDGTVFYRSPASYLSTNSGTFSENAVKIEIKGPSGQSIKLPVPDSFVPFQESSKEIDPADETKAYYTSGDNSSTGPWGTLFPVEVEPSIDGGYAAKYWVEPVEPEIIRAFSSPIFNNESFMQANPNSEYYGAGTFLYDGMGVRPSEIVKQLAILEGWDIGNIVDTEFVPCSDKFKMQKQTALQFIQDVLVPVSITPTGSYTLAEDYYDSTASKSYSAGSKVTFTTGFAGFVPYFKNNKFYFEPLNSEMLKTTHDFSYNYNSKNSEILSFQVNTKGTAFYTEQSVQMNSLSIVTGETYSEIQINSPTALEEYNKVDIHNENLDNFFGFSYEEVDSRVGNTTPNNYTTDLDSWFDVLIGQDININSTQDLYSNEKVITAATAVNNNLVTYLPSSGMTSTSEVSTSLTSAYEKIKQFAITASLSIYGDVEVNPGDYINVNVILDRVITGTNIHPSSGKYLILSQQDTVGGSGFVQTLSLFRATDLDKQISPQKINWSADITHDKTSIIDNR